MQYRTLGSQGLEVSAIGYGTMGLTMSYGPGDTAQGIAAIQRAHDLGVTFFDTAEFYGWGTGSNEKLLGEAVKGFRDEVVLGTKFGIDMSLPPEQIGGALDSRPETIRKVADNSLRYLGVDHIDVFYQHRVDPDVPIEEVAGTVKELIDAGKVKYFGLSEAGPETIRRAHAVQPVSVLQTEYSLFERDVERVFPTLDELGIGFVAYAPLGRGFITGGAKPAGQYDATDIRNVDAR
ncbi:aldo/keto reductase, partial [Streptomyces kunmingensis]